MLFFLLAASAEFFIRWSAPLSTFFSLLLIFVARFSHHLPPLLAVRRKTDLSASFIAYAADPSTRCRHGCDRTRVRTTRPLTGQTFRLAIRISSERTSGSLCLLVFRPCREAHLTRVQQCDKNVWRRMFLRCSRGTRANTRARETREKEREPLIRYTCIRRMIDGVEPRIKYYASSDWLTEQRCARYEFENIRLISMKNERSGWKNRWNELKKLFDTAAGVLFCAQL